MRALVVSLAWPIRKSFRAGQLCPHMDGGLPALRCSWSCQLCAARRHRREPSKCFVWGWLEGPTFQRQQQRSKVDEKVGEPNESGEWSTTPVASTLMRSSTWVGILTTGGCAWVTGVRIDVPRAACCPRPINWPTNERCKVHWNSGMLVASVCPDRHINQPTTMRRQSDQEAMASKRRQARRRQLWHTHVPPRLLLVQFRVVRKQQHAEVPQTQEQPRNTPQSMQSTIPTHPTRPSRRRLRHQPNDRHYNTTNRTNEPTNQPTNRRTNEPTNELLNKPTNQPAQFRTAPANELRNEPTNEPTNQRTNKIPQRTNKRTSQPTNELRNQRTSFGTNERSQHTTTPQHRTAPPQC